MFQATDNGQQPTDLFHKIHPMFSKNPIFVL